MRCGSATWRLALRVGAVASGLIVFAPPAAAQGPVSLTLEDAVRRGVAQAPRLAEARAREAAAESTLTARWATAMPTASVASSFTRTNHVDEVRIPQADGGSRLLFPDIPNNTRVRAEIFVPVYAFGRVGATLAAARSDIDATGADRRAAEADVRLEVARAYWWLVTARDTVRVISQSLARTDAWVGDVKARVDAGILPPNDLLSAQAQRARHAVRLIQARNDEALAELDLARLIGEPAGTRIATASRADQPAPGVTDVAALAPEALVARAIGDRPERAALSARSSGLRSSAEAALANLRPYITGLAAVEPARPNTRFVPPTDAWRTSWSLGVNVTWPIFDSGRSRAEAGALFAQADAVDARRADFEALLAIEIRQRLLDLDAGRAAIAASGEAVAAATEARRVVEERFRAGVATSTDVLDAQVALLEAEVELTRLHAQLRLSEARLMRAVGAGQS